MVLLAECLDYLFNTRDTIVLVGDLNLPNIDWFSLNSPDDNIHSVFLKLCTQFGLYQFVDSPTRDNHILDLVLSSDHNIMSDLQVINPFSTSDHEMVEFSLIVAQHEISNAEPRIMYDYDNADFDGIVQYLSNDCFLSSPNIELGESVDQVWDKFSRPITDAIQSFVPKRVVHKRSTKNPRYRPRHTGEL